ncbi:MAG: hypothetical protein ACI8PB_005178 [Desulforhopalus sp.]|jgi:hypothetical protein
MDIQENRPRKREKMILSRNLNLGKTRSASSRNPAITVFYQAITYTQKVTTYAAHNLLASIRCQVFKVASSTN